MNDRFFEGMVKNKFGNATPFGYHHSLIKGAIYHYLIDLITEEVQFYRTKILRYENK